MRNLIKKIKSKSGETFVEIIIAILICAFGCLLLATLFTSAFNMNMQAKEQDDNYYSTLNGMTATGGKKGEGKIKITIKDGDGSSEMEVDVDTYGTDDLTSYRKQKGD